MALQIENNLCLRETFSPLWEKPIILHPTLHRRENK